MAQKHRLSGREPTPLALLLAHGLEEDASSGRFSLSGIFFRIAVVRFPSIYPMCVYACLTDGRGLTSLTLRLVDVDELRPPLWAHSIDFDFDDPAIVLDLGIDWPDTRIHAPGIYRLQLIADGATILERSIYVEDASEEVQE